MSDTVEMAEEAEEEEEAVKGRSEVKGAVEECVPACLELDLGRGKTAEKRAD